MIINNRNRIANTKGISTININKQSSIGLDPFTHTTDGGHDMPSQGDAWDSKMCVIELVDTEDEDKSS